ncbi:hypothetical protein Pedsa_1850 [Pseudopedobacter saltans DSM 12145]|uniref:DUF1735 domain-containing protein n=1 Tax=Pseudopedobacter saltans (strain ATCC 51119 / DSM 12145 / JCM 21818 / CCUG 39354 / LMG 10337 / NBRC 100064 / NCIMB 13643) TaxID=762903 RepID=F0S8S4_PSESL|nr:hypothetical protein [Pseudopedobacter saltans]ADY52405.1 hypothetical protein Pedsa_1850 [Pseudopedobacter saltans DSM 12145]
MKLFNLKYMLLILIGATFLQACEKDADQWLKDNVTVIGKVPVIAAFSVTPAQADNKVPTGQTIKLDLRYWSDEPIDKIELRSMVGTGGTYQLVETKPYQSAYSVKSKTDSLIFNYTVPNVAVGTAINMEVTVVNKNTLVKKSVLALAVK